MKRTGYRRFVFLCVIEEGDLMRASGKAFEAAAQASFLLSLYPGLLLCSGSAKRRSALGWR